MVDASYPPPTPMVPPQAPPPAPTPAVMEAPPIGAAATAPGPPQANYATSDALIAGMGDPLAQTNSMLQRNRAALAPQQAAVQRAGQDYQRAAANVPPQPQQAAPEPQQGMGLQAAGEWVAVATVLGAIAGAMTRRSTTNALAAFTGALEGAAAGNKQAFEQNKVIWEQENKRINQQLQQQRDAYLDILNSKKTDFNMQMLLLQQEATKQHDDIMAQAAARREQLEVAKILDVRERERVKGEQAYIKSQEALKKAGDTPEAKQQLELRAQAIANYQQAPVTNPRQPQDRELMARVMELNPEYRAGEYAGEVSAQRALGTKLVNFGIRDEAATNALNLLQTASNNLPRGNWTGLNKAVQAGQEQISDPNLKKLVVAINTFSNEYAAVVNYGGPPRVNDIQHAREMLSASDGPRAMNAAIEQLGAEIRGAEKALSTIKERTGRRGLGQTPEAATGAGAAPASSPSRTPTPGTVEDGYRFKGGNPGDPTSWEKVQ